QQRTFRPRTRRSRPEAGPAPPRRAPRDMSTYWLKLHDMRFPLRLGETLLGRSPYCSIVLNDNLVSRQHAVVHVTRDGLYIEDLGSRNGTRVNRALVTGQHPLYPGDR